MNFTQIWSKALLAVVTVTAGFASPLTLARQPAPASVAPPPPELQMLDEGGTPAMTIRKPGEEQSSGDSIEERRDHGRTTEIKVHSGPSTYYLKPKEQVGSALPGDAQSGPPTSAQWLVKEFDWDSQPQPENGDDTDPAQ